MTGNIPLVTIGVPTYNGEQYIRQALDSLLAQDFEDFELIISDNASEDRTREICLEYSKRDQRVKYYRNNSNMGLDQNFNQVFKLSRSPYFTWASSDDTRHTSFLSACLEVLENNESIVLCYSEVLIIGSNGHVVGLKEDDKLEISSDDPAERFRQSLWKINSGTPIHAVIRSSAMKKTKLLGGFLNSDVVFLKELSLLGNFHQVARPLFYRRAHDMQASKRALYSSNPMEVYPYYRRRFRLRRVGDIVNTLRVLKRSHLRTAEKVTLLWEILKCFTVRFGSHIARELTTGLWSELKRVVKNR